MRLLEPSQSCQQPDLKKMLKVHKWVRVNQRLWDKLIAPIKGEILAPEVL